MSYTSYKVDPECIKLRQRFRVTDLLLVLTEAYSIFVHIGHGAPTPCLFYEGDVVRCMNESEQDGKVVLHSVHIPPSLPLLQV